MIKVPFYDSKGFAARGGFYRTEEGSHVHFTGEYENVKCAGGRPERQAKVLFRKNGSVDEDFVDVEDFEKLIRLEMKDMLGTLDASQSRKQPISRGPPTNTHPDW
jgi:hypothetical protein